MMTRRTLWCCALSSLVFTSAWASPQSDELREDFSSVPDGSTPEAWRIVSGGWQVLDGALVGDGREGDGRVVLSGGERIDFSFAVDVVFESVTEPSRWVALTFAEAQDSAARGAPRYHTFTVRLKTSTPDGLEHAARTADGNWNVRVGRPHSRDLQPGKTARLEVQVVRGRVRGLIDGELVLDDALAADVAIGELGIHVAGARAIFDNLHVRPLSSAAVAALRVPRDPRRAPVIIAHRGASHRAPENTLSALRLAVESGAEGCEFDVYKTADDQLVLFHDKDLDRTTDFQQVYGKGSDKESRIAALTLEELRRLDAGSWKSPRFRGERIPTFLEALDDLRGKITPVIEIKPDDIGRQVAEVIRQADMVEEVFVQSFSPRAIRDVRAELPQVPTGLLIGGAGLADPTDRAVDHLRRAREAGASAIVCHYRSIAPEYLRAIHRRAMSVWVYTVNDGATLALLRDMGVDGIITDLPAEALRIRSHSSSGTDVTGGLQAPASPTASGTASGSGARRITIVAGEISVLEFARYYSDAIGIPLIAEGGDKRWEDEKILVPSTVRDAGPELVKALLGESGYTITERRLPDGRRVAFMGRARATAVPTTPRETPIVKVTSATRAPRRRAHAATAEAPETGRVDFSGLTIVTVPEMLVAQTALSVGAGAFVRARDEEAGGLADMLRRFDVITYVGSERVRSPIDFKRKIGKIRRGQRIYVRVLRNGKTVILPVRG